jgi:hypothetical protein
MPYIFRWRYKHQIAWRRLQLSRFGDQTVPVQAALIPKQQIVILPEFALLPCASGSFRSALREGMNLGDGHVAEGQRYRAFMLGQHVFQGCLHLPAIRTLEI